MILRTKKDSFEIYASFQHKAITAKWQNTICFTAEYELRWKSLDPKRCQCRNQAGRTEGQGVKYSDLTCSRQESWMKTGVVNGCQRYFHRRRVSRGVWIYTCSCHLQLTLTSDRYHSSARQESLPSVAGQFDEAGKSVTGNVTKVNGTHFHDFAGSIFYSTTFAQFLLWNILWTMVHTNRASTVESSQLANCHLSRR